MRSTITGVLLSIEAQLATRLAPPPPSRATAPAAAAPRWGGQAPPPARPPAPGSRHLDDAHRRGGDRAQPLGAGGIDLEHLDPRHAARAAHLPGAGRSEGHTSEL